ncbi:MAG TPA: LacI family DNA-binding transcriptional regulator [Aggregatilineaceae bacterium]|nr:LacI family DNA-binding transcriptional regulator [Aggregatilineaceae bacterium]
MPTIIDVAKRAGVAASTVSYAINGTRPISEETRQRIFAAMDELGYQPNALARGLASKRSRIIAFHFPVPERGVGLTEIEFITSAANTAREYGYQMVLWTSELHNIEELRQSAQQGLVDGVVAMEVYLHDERIQLWREMGLPFSLIGRNNDTAGIPYVDSNFEQAATETVNYLTELQHTHIAFLSQSRSVFESGYGPVVRTQQSYEQAVQAVGLTPITQCCHASASAGYEIFESLLAADPDLTALVTINDRAVPGVMQAITDRGWRIPDQFSLVVIGSSAGVAELMSPSVTTVEPPNTQMGRLGVELLIQQLEGQVRANSQVLLPCPLVIRASSGPRRP